MEITKTIGGELSLGVDIGGTKVLVVALDQNNVIAAEARTPTPRAAVLPIEDLGPGEGGRAGIDAGSQVADAVGAVIDEVTSSLGLTRSSPTIPVGVGIPGMLDRSSTLRFAPNLQGAVGSDFKAVLSKRLEETPLLIENDANFAAFAEHEAGAAQGHNEALMVTLGTGIGGGVISRGEVLVGARGFAGEIGHMIVDPSGPLCPCGRRGCWERYASGAGLGRLAREASYAGRLHGVVSLAGGDPELVRGEHVSDAARNGDKGALEVMDDLGWWVGLGFANLVSLFDPECIVLGGGLAGAGDLLLGPAKKAFLDLVEGGANRDPIAIRAAHFGERAGAVGAAMAARAGGF